MVTNALSVQGPSSPFAQLRTAALRIFGPSQRRSPDLRNRTLEADQLREFALTFVESDPRFATDLFAAADRHEEV
jgi:hypothetical protein